MLFLFSFKDVSESHGKKHRCTQRDGEAWLLAFLSFLTKALVFFVSFNVHFLA